MFVVLDTNIWLHELALQTPLGSAVRFFLRQGGHKLVVPEVIRLEVEKNLRRELREWRDSIAEDHRKLLAMFGKLHEVKLPSDADIEQRVASVFDASGLDIVAVPFSLESARASLLKAIDGAAPSGPKNQQFKDGVIWADCMQLLEHDDVTLVTEDRAFYFDRAKTDLGPAENLAAEAKARAHKIVLIPDLGKLLKSVRAPVSIDEDALAAAMLRRSGQQIDGLLTRLGHRLGDRESMDLKLFATEVPTRLAGEASASYCCPDVTGASGRRDGILWVTSTFEYDTARGEFVALRPEGEILETTDENGFALERSNRYLHPAPGVIGHRSVSHVVRAPLRDAP